MRNLLTPILLAICLPLFAQTTTGAMITWEKAKFDFGDIAQGDKVEHTFKFRNAGTEPLVITNVQVTCGCTIPKGWARDPIAPGETGEITIGFNSAGKYGKQEKVVTIVSNAVNQDGSQIAFSANVLDRKLPQLILTA